MRGWLSSLLGLSLLVVAVVADDLSYCKSTCEKKFEDKQLESCSDGCLHRGSIEDGTRAFADCHAYCEKAYNETEVQAITACNFACSLPKTNMVFMKVDYRTGDAPRVQVLRKEGGDFGANDFRKFLLKPSDLGDDSAGDVPRPVAPMSRDDDIPMGGVLSNMLNIRTGDAEFDKMQENVGELMRTFMERAKFAKMAGQRPSGHDDLALEGPIVGNSDIDGHQLIMVRPLLAKNQNKDSFDIPSWEDERRTLESIFSRREHLRRFPALFQWTVCFVLLIAILCTMIVALLILRHMKIHRYRQLRTPAAGGFAPKGQAEPLPEKKIPIDVESTSLPEPSGVPPPAYDQLSVHSIPKH